MMQALRFVLVVGLAVLSSARAAPVEIHPAGQTIPENLLRIELRFERPQRLPFDIQRLALLDEKGVEIQNALLDLALPGRDGRRITILMDPGRVKSGAGPNLDAGRAIRDGETVSLRLADPGAGTSPVVKTWRVTAAVSRPLQPANWALTLPRRGSRDALVVHMQAPISSSGEGLIAVLDGHGRPIHGRTALGDGDSAWRFTPDRPWAPGQYAVVTHPDLEDAAGNRTCAAFEQAHGSRVSCGKEASIPFGLMDAIGKRVEAGIPSRAEPLRQ